MKVCLILLALILSGCKKSDPGPNSKILFPLETPIVYARYDNLPALLRVQITHCNSADGFRLPDLCGPTPGQSNKTPWQIPSGIQSFHWEQDLQTGEKLQVEITDSEGILLPATVEILKRKNRFLAQIKPSNILPSHIVMLITATLFDHTGKKLNSWSVPFKISGN